MISKIKRSLTLKMFLLISISFVVIFAAVLFFQSRFFSRYYETAKVNNTIHKINELSERLESQDWEIEDLYREVKAFGSDNNVTVQLQGIEISDEYDKYSLVTVEDENKRNWEFYLSNTYNIVLLRSMVEKEFTIKGYIQSDKMLIVTHINENQISDYESDDLEGYQGTVNILERGKITDILPKSSLRSALMRVRPLERSKEGVSYTIAKLLYSNTKTVMMIKPVHVLSSNATIYVMASLQPVDEAVSMLSGYIPLFSAFAIGLSVIIAIIYSRSVSRPIVKITQTANRMANMDFSVKEETNRVDELGVLASSINSLSGNLENVLDELKSANAKLKEDYENELRQELARRDFIANASHELKTPLGVIKSYVEAVRDNINYKKRNYYFDVIMDETSKMDELIMQMLALAKLDADDSKLDIELVDMGKVIKEVAQRFSGIMREQELELEVRGEFAVIEADREKIHQVLYNFIDNAVKYSTPQTVISITGTKKNNMLRIEFENACEQVDANNLDKVWDRFYKMDISHNRGEEGSGLGLAIVKSILDRHGYPYGVSTTCKGILFWVEFGNHSSI